MVLYADVLFAINFSMDFLALFITTRIMHKKLYKIKIIVAAAVGGAYSIFEMLSALNNPFLEILLNFLIALMMCFIAFKEKRFSRFLGVSAMFWGVSTLLGGAISLIFNAFNKLFYKYLANSSFVASNSYNQTRFFLIIIIGVLLSLVFSRLYMSKSDIKEVDVKIFIDEEKFELKGLCDSGNLLTEPITGKSVVLVSNHSKIGEKIKALPEYKKRYIPYNSVSSEGILMGIAPTNTFINEGERDIIVAAVDKKDFAGYEALVPISIV